MRKTMAAALMVASLLAAGCLGGDTPTEEQTPAEAAPSAVYEDDRIKIETIPETQEAQAPTLEAAPRWQLGEWWDVVLTDEFTGGTLRTTRVVAGQEESNYLVGMPMHDFSNGIMVFHIPGFGQISKNDLSFEIHDCPFHPLKFPLVEGETWETQFECRDVTATVVKTTDTTADVEILGQNDHITLTYDAEMRAITKLRKDGYAAYEITGHGYDFHEAKPGMGGQVTVPHMHDVIFMHGRIGGALWSQEGMPLGLGPKPPTDTVTVDSTYDRVSFAIILGNIFAQGPVGGYYKETATAPDGTVFELEMTPDDGNKFKIETFKHDAPGGDWTFEHIAAGPGIAMAEGIAYHVYDILLPEGTILPSVGEHQHGDPCAHGC